MNVDVLKSQHGYTSVGPKPQLVIVNPVNLVCYAEKRHCSSAQGDWRLVVLPHSNTRTVLDTAGTFLHDHYDRCD